MPADHQSLISARRWLIAPVLASLLLVLGGCASSQAMHGPSAPDFSPIAPAQQALNKALDAQAGDLAPRSVDAARRRITIARDILYSAADQHRPLNDREDDRVQQLVSAAQLDAKAAQVQAQAQDVQSQIADVKGRLGQNNGAASGAANTNADQSSGGSPTGLGPSAYGDARNNSGVSQ